MIEDLDGAKAPDENPQSASSCLLKSLVYRRRISLGSRLERYAGKNALLQAKPAQAFGLIFAEGEKAGRVPGTFTWLKPSKVFGKKQAKAFFYPRSKLLHDV